MGNHIDENFIKTYSDKTYQHTAMVNHRGTVVSFAMDDKRRIYYAVLDAGKEDKNRGPLDVKYWLDNPQPLFFPEEIEQVGFAALNPVQMPTVKKGGRLEESDRRNVSPSEIDAFLSTTARLTADAPFQVFSDNQHVYVFRQSLAGNHADMVYKLISGASSGTETELTKLVTDSDSNRVPVVTETLLVDRFILAGTELKLPREVRFRRSENRTNPASAKDSLGAKDMEGNAFYETTKELNFVRNLANGCFSVILLPTQVADIERWQIFAFNKLSKEVESFNIERAEDGFFNLQGTQLYTSPDPHYQASVLERNPGSCPFTGRPLVPNDASGETISTSGHARRALRFDGSGDHVNIKNKAAMQITGDQTIEMWIKPAALAKRQNPFDKAYSGEGAITLEANGQLSYYFGIDGGVGLAYNSVQSTTQIAADSWTHIAIVRDLGNAQGKTLHWYINGLSSGSAAATHAAAKKSTQPVFIGKGYAGNFDGLIDEVRVWNYARSAFEISKTLNHRLVGDEFGLAGYWRFDEAAGNEVKDLTGNGSHGKLSGAGVTWVDSDAPVGEPIGDQTDMQRASFAFGDQQVETGLAARLYYQQEKESSAAEAKSIKQSARVLLTAVASGLDPRVPVSKGLSLYLCGESYFGGNQWHDLSGQGRHAFTKYGSPMPSLHQVAKYQGKYFPVMRFDYGPSMTVSNNTMDAPLTAMIVDRYTDPENTDATLASAAAGKGDSHWHLGKRFGKNLFYTHKAHTSDDQRVYVGQAEDAINNVFSINTGTIDGTEANWYLDGVSKGSTTISGGVKGMLGLGQAGLRADIACILIWDRVLTDTERQTVEKWLGVKYGINVNHSVDLAATAKKYVAAVDFGVSREGKLAQMPAVIPLSPVLSPNAGGAASDGILGEISSLETDIPRLETEIARLTTEIASLKTDIQSDEAKVATIPTVEGNIARLDSNLKYYQQPRYATFYQHGGQKGESFTMATGQSKSELGGWNDRISSYSFDGGLKVEAFQHINYGGTKSILGQDSFRNDTYSSIKVLEADWLKNNRTRTQTELHFNTAELTSITDIRDKQLPPKKTQYAQNNTLLQTKQAELNVKNPRLTELRTLRIGTPPPQAMRSIHTDPRGLTISSALLAFAYTDSQPYLFESALGRMALYFKGVNKQFFSAYYDVNTARARWSLAAGSGSLTLISRAADREVNATAIVVANGKDADHCKVTIKNTQTGLTEIWRDVPREASAFAQVLNGEVTEKIYVGMLGNSLSGTAVTTIALKDGLPREAPAGSTLVFEGNNSLDIKVSATAASGSKQIGTETVTADINVDTKVYLLLYDYTNAQANRAGYKLDSGNLQVDVIVGSATGEVGNATASRTAEAHSAQWTADAPGSALYFDGTDDYLDGQPHNNFQHEGDITLEAWARPLDFTGDTRLVHCKSGGSHYSLGLREAPVNSSLSFDGNRDYVNLASPAALQITADQTIEMWIKPASLSKRQNPFDKAHAGEGAITIETNGHLTYYYGIDGGKGPNYERLPSSTSIAVGAWVHIAIVRDLTNMTMTWYINGDPSGTAESTYPAAKKSTSPVYIGSGYAGYFSGSIDEVRIWNIARDATAIKANMSRRLGGQEPGLVAYYHFENRDANDRSGNGHHGTLHGDLTSRAPVTSPLKAYTCFAAVGSDAIVATEPVASHSWHHFAAVYNQSYALRFDSNAVGDAGTESMLNITEDVTIEAFIKLDSLGRKHGIVSKGIMDNGDGSSVPYAFYIDESGKLVLAFEDEDGKNYRYSSSSGVTVDAFQRVAVVRKIGKEKIEKTGTTVIKYKDDEGEEQTRTVNTIESIDFKENSDIRFYIDSTDAGTHIHKGKKPIGNSGALYIGQSYIANQERAQFQGVISELRIWNTARAVGDVNTKLLGSEGGLTAWWRFEENTGNIAYDAKGGNHARISGAQWVKNPNTKASSFIIYRDGNEAASKHITRPAMGDTQFTVGARKQGNYREHFKGNLEELRIWKTARRKEEILDNLFTRLKGEKHDLLANYSLDDSSANEVKDGGLNSVHLTLPASADHQPLPVLSTAPISNDTAQVRSALAGVKTDFHEQISGRPAAAEYADMQRLEDTTLIGVHKRCYAYTKNGKWLLLTGYKVGNLITEWIGQAQFDPQVTGYIEGAPPVPSENLTEGYYHPRQTFNGTSEVTINESESVNYSVSSSKESGFSSGFTMDAKLGLGLEPRIIVAPLGIGGSKKFKISMASNFNLSMEANGTWSSGESFGSGQNITRKMSAGIGGNWDVADKTKWLNPELSRRFIPANIGFAFVESETADIYALRLEHNGALVAFRMLPNLDIPKDTNVIPFPINNRYSKQGTLDGRVGYTGTGVVLDADYANATGYGEYSYFKPKEAYALKKRIEREAQRLKDYYDNFNSTPAGTGLMGGLAGGSAAAVGGTAILGAAGAAKLGASVAMGPAIAPILSGAMIAGGMGATVGSLIDASTTQDNDLPNKYARRNIANTYVWTADGGFYEESTEISEVRSESKSGSYSFSGKGTGGFAMEVKSGVSSNFGLNGMLGGSLNLTKSKSEEASSSFNIAMKLLVPDNLQQYEYNTPDDTSSGVKGVYDSSGNPVSQPGKVDAYRFMTFHLEPELNNFEDLFGKVIDPIWLEESQHPNAMALRQANQATRKPKCWRVFHRVTFVSRILPDFPSTTAPTLEKKMKDLDIASNYELVRRLEPFVSDHTADFIQFKDAVKAAVEAYLPELSGEADLNQITLFLADYHAVSY